MTDPSLEERIAAIEAEIRADREARRSSQAEAPSRPSRERPPRRPSPEELGYVTTDDSFGKILDDLLDRLNSDPGASR